MCSVLFWFAMFAMGKIKKPCCFKNVKEFILFMQRNQEKQIFRLEQKFYFLANKSQKIFTYLA